MLLTQAIIGEFFQGVPLPGRGPASHMHLAAAYSLLCSTAFTYVLVPQGVSFLGGMHWQSCSRTREITMQIVLQVICAPSQIPSVRCQLAAVSYRYRCVARCQGWIAVSPPGCLLCRPEHQVCMAREPPGSAVDDWSVRPELWACLRGARPGLCRPKLTAMFGRCKHAQPCWPCAASWHCGT